MKVLKFGGTSVGTVFSLTHVKKIVEDIEQPAVVVVSALGGVTDKLILTARKAASGDASYEAEFNEIASRHYEIIESLVPEEKKEDIRNSTDCLLKKLSRILNGLELIEMLPDLILDTVVSFGERLSSQIVAAIIKGGRKFDSLEFIKTEKWNGKNIASNDLIAEKIKTTFSESYDKAIVPGFISTDKDTGEITNLGRGGSDFTAALIAAALDADILEIWTDVDGFMTADPRVVKEAHVIPHLSFSESMDLCNYGAKVIYPPTIYPVFLKNIPIKILNTFNPSAPGSLINEMQESHDKNLKGVTALKNMAVISLRKLNPAEGILLSSRALNILSKNGIRIFPMDNAEPDNEFTFAVNNSEAQLALRFISTEFAPEISVKSLEQPLLIKDLSAVAVVGWNIKSDMRVGARIKNSLVRDGVNVVAMSSQSSENTMSFLVDAANTDKAVNIIHNLLFV